MTDTSSLQTNVKPLAYVDTTSHIPIHGSDRATFKRCRQAWEFSAPSRYNLVPKITYEGINFNLWFGSLVHKALEEYYHPALRRNPVEVFETAYLDGIYDSKNRRVVYGVNQIRTINPSFYELEGESFEYHRELGIQMLEYYLTWSPERDDDLEVLSTETDFAIPMGTAVDVRDGVEKEIWYKGRMDAVVRSKSTGKVAIMDHKTTSSISDDYFQKLELDEQCTSYIWAAQRTLGSKVGEISGIWYNVLRKAAPTSPTILKDGTLSVSRSQESTTPKLWMEAVEDHNLQAWFQTNERAIAYYDYLLEMGDSQFIQRHFVPRNQHEIRYFENQLIDELDDMTHDPKLYRNPSGDFMCTKCAFRAPCIAKGDGSDWQFMLQQNYERNSDR